MKKTLAIALALMLCLGLLAACGSPTVVIYDGASTPAADPIASEEPSASEEPNTWGWRNTSFWHTPSTTSSKLN